MNTLEVSTGIYSKAVLAAQEIAAREIYDAHAVDTMLDYTKIAKVGYQINESKDSLWYFQRQDNNIIVDVVFTEDGEKVRDAFYYSL
jgi:hypothetical protein